ncbi:hypothetical protein CC2G_002520 [Coprinopsis cinerea AmutBmut pab1-1]|nr:hypothetical protein CC2G_002520 [Coprinopsis cinerea AmutBmut pab1-1]
MALLLITSAPGLASIAPFASLPERISLCLHWEITRGPIFCFSATDYSVRPFALDSVFHCGLIVRGSVHQRPFVIPLLYRVPFLLFNNDSFTLINELTFATT